MIQRDFTYQVVNVRVDQVAWSLRHCQLNHNMFAEKAWSLFAAFKTGQKEFNKYVFQILKILEIISDEVGNVVI